MERKNSILEASSSQVVQLPAARKKGETVSKPGSGEENRREHVRGVDHLSSHSDHKNPKLEGYVIGYGIAMPQV